MEEIEKNLDELERNLSKTEKYYDYDDAEYRGIKDVKDLFDLSIDEDSYKPIITKIAFNNNYIQYDSSGNKDKTLTINEYLDIIRPHLRDIINDHKTQGEWRIHSGNTVTKHKTQSEWKIKLTMVINLISSILDSDETCTMRTKSNNVEIMMVIETDEVIEELFKSLSQRYQERLEESLKGSKFIFDSVDRGGSYINSPEWLKNMAIMAVTLNHKQIKSHSERISNIKPFIDQYNWKEIFHQIKKDWKKFESNNKSIALNILYVPHNTKEIRHAYKSKYKLKCKNQVILLTITDGEKWHYLAVKKLSPLLRGITGNNNEDFYCLHCFCSYTTENKLGKHRNVCENHDYCYVEMPKEYNKILKYNHGEKSMKAPFVIYADLESLTEKMSTYYNNPITLINIQPLVVRCLQSVHLM